MDGVLCSSGLLPDTAWWLPGGSLQERWEAPLWAAVQPCSVIATLAVMPCPTCLKCKRKHKSNLDALWDTTECRDTAKSNVDLKSDSCSVFFFHKCKTSDFANQAASLPSKTSVPWIKMYSLQIKKKSHVTPPVCRLLLMDFSDVLLEKMVN